MNNFWTMDKIGRIMLRVFVVMCCAALLGNVFFVFQNYSMGSDDSTSLKPMSLAQDLAGHNEQDVREGVSEMEQPVKNIYYIKVHKTGSTTLQNIFYRFGIANDLKIAVYNCRFGMPFPDIARPRYLFENINYGAFKPYNLVIDHAVYDDTYPFGYMETGVKTVATLREPLSYLRSAFSFFHLQKHFRIKDSGNPVKEFLFSDPESFRHKTTKAYNWTKNLQLYSFGYQNRQNNDPAVIQSFIENRIDKNIDLIFTLDRFDEGLILLKRQFHWHTKDIVFKILWSTAKSKKMPLQENEAETKRMNEIYKRFSLGDYMLYEYFKNKLDKQIAAQDSTFQEEVRELRDINAQISTFCSMKCSNMNRTVMLNMSAEDARMFIKTSIHIAASPHGFHNGFNISYADCILMGFFTFDFQVAVRVHQFPNACHASQEPPFISKPVWNPPKHDIYRLSWCNEKSHVVYSFPWKVVFRKYLRC